MPRVGPVCPYCSSPSRLSDASAVYGPTYAGRYNLWICERYPECDAYVGVHSNSPDAAPMGSLANAELRKLRKTAHDLFDGQWKTGRMKRPEAYRNLEKLMGRSKGKAHIAGFDEDQCRRVIMAYTIPDIERGLNL